MLVLSRKVGESLIIGNDIEVTLLRVLGDRVKIGIQAPNEVQIQRNELLGHTGRELKKRKMP